MPLVPLTAPASPNPAAARLTKGRATALACFLVGGGLLPAVLGLFWYKFGQIDRLAIASAVGVSTVVELFGVAQLVVLQRAMKRIQTPVSRRHMQIQFCRTSIERLGPGKEPLLSALREREHSPMIKECLNRCQDCKLGMLVATADGMPVIAKDGDKLLGDIDELAAADI